MGMYSALTLHARIPLIRAVYAVSRSARSRISRHAFEIMIHHRRKPRWETWLSYSAVSGSSTYARTSAGSHRDEAKSHGDTAVTTEATVSQISFHLVAVLVVRLRFPSYSPALCLSSLLWPLSWREEDLHLPSTKSSKT